MKHIIIALVSAVFLISCGEKKSPVNELHVSSFGDPKTFNPITSTETSSWEVLQFVFEGLTEYDPLSQKCIGGMAKSWTASADGLKWDFVLRDNLFWSDGVPVTADDIVFSFKAIYNPKNISMMRDNLTINGKEIIVEKIDPRTIRLILPCPFAPLLKMLIGPNMPIVPAHRLAVAENAGSLASTWEVNTPPDSIIGSGPFRISQYASSQQLVLERNPYYWKKDSAGKTLPALDRITFTYVKDISAELLKFKNGETDYFEMRGEDYPALKPGEKDGNYTIYNLGAALGDVFIIFNQNPHSDIKTGKPYVESYKSSWFRNLRFRQAIAYAIDRKSMINIVHNGLAELQHGPMVAASGYFACTDIRKYDFNPDSAKVILAAEGFSDTDGDGILEDRNGHKVEFSLFTNSGNTIRKKYAELIRKDLENVGIKVNFSVLEFNNLVDKLGSSYDWESIVLGLTGSDEPHVGAGVWLSSARMHEWNPSQRSPETAWEARVDTIFIQGAMEMDMSKRKVLYDEWQRLYAENLPYIEMPAPMRLFAVRNRFDGLKPAPLAEAAYFSKRKFFWNIEEISVK